MELVSKPLGSLDLIAMGWLDEVVDEGACWGRMPQDPVPTLEARYCQTSRSPPLFNPSRLRAPIGATLCQTVNPVRPPEVSPDTLI